MYYGLTHASHAVDMARVVCDVLGHGVNNTGVHQVIETCQQETHLGLFRDRTDYGAGFGLSQIDKIGFDDVQIRTRVHHKEALREKFDIDINIIEHRELEHSPLLSIIVCRLHYKLKPEPFPADVEGRAHYWKKHYNSEAGKGTVEEYLENARELEGLL
jgi:hypothetical protein